MPTIHQLEREQTIATELDTAWNFISAPQNLDRITPDDMDFENSDACASSELRLVRAPDHFSAISPGIFASSSRLIKIVRVG